MTIERAAILAGALAFAAFAVIPACSSIDPTAASTIECPTADNFRSVSAVLERRCGTIDCHGQAERPLRIYGQYGLRRPEPADSINVKDYAQYYPGGQEATTQAELDDNIISLCGLEPEIMTLVVKDKSDTGELTLVRKARLEEKHKGGRVWFKGTEGDRCFVSWLDGSIKETGPGACEDELSRNR